MLVKFLNCNSVLRRVLKPSQVWSIHYMSNGEDIKTHTGQKFEANDYRLVRFLDKKKLVNTSFAIDLICKVSPKVCNARVVWCDGGGGPTGHPKVYINLDKPGEHSCGYCGLRFEKAPSH